MKIHDLKIDPEYFDDVITGEKRFEVRKNDRGFKKGDLLNLQEYDREKKEYTGRKTLIPVRYILDNQEYLREGYVILGL